MERQHVFIYSEYHFLDEGVASEQKLKNWPPLKLKVTYTRRFQTISFSFWHQKKLTERFLDTLYVYCICYAVIHFVIDYLLTHARYLCFTSYTYILSLYLSLYKPTIQTLFLIHFLSVCLSLAFFLSLSLSSKNLKSHWSS